MDTRLILTVTGVAALALSVVALRGLGADDVSSGAKQPSGGPDLVVGSANFPENALLAQIYAGALTEAGFEVDTALDVGSREVLFPAMERGDITVVPEYTGALLDHLAGDAARPTTGTSEQLVQLEEVLPGGLRLLAPSEAQDQETVTCTTEVVERYSLTSLADLGPVSGELVMGGPPELAQRSGRFSLTGLEEQYGVVFADFVPLDVAGPLTVAALQDGKIDCANLFSTQSAIAVNGFVVLADPEGLIQSQAVVPLLTDDAATPMVTEALDAVSAALTTAQLRDMVARVEIDKDDPAAVAADFLGEHGLG